MNKIIIVAAIGLSIILFSCSTSVKKQSDDASLSANNQPVDIYLQKEVKASVDSLFLLHRHATNALSFGDSVGARIYYEKIFSLISEYDEETKSMLLEWSEYDSLIKKINSDYESIFTQDVFDQEAEEIREELTDYEWDHINQYNAREFEANPINDYDSADDSSDFED